MGDLLVFGAPVPLLLSLLLLLVFAAAAGALGSLLGIGGGVVLVPLFFLVFGLDIHVVIAASLVSVIATSTGAASTEMEEGFTNLRLGMFLEVATSVGGLVGAVIAVTVLASRGQLLILVFVPVVLVAAAAMYVQRRTDVRPDVPPDRISRYLDLSGECPDPERGTVVHYAATRTGTGLVVSAFAGVAAGLLGLGGGLFKVPAMSAVMNVPIRVAGATSTFMIGVTAAAAGLVYLIAGDVSLLVAGPAAIGTVLGSRAGAGLRHRASAPWLKEAFVVVLVVAAASMLAQATGVLP
ncbi:MAG TPA: sulfite exporter TauE/SafE family protein [Thermoplasmata archaeon]|nr:sulfite exporter TauE/SafE family protein [Thermoplasmata archaeon]